MFVKLIWEIPTPTFIIVGWSIHQTGGLEVYPHCFFGHRLELGLFRVRPHLRVAIAGPHSSITMLEVNNGLGSNRTLLWTTLYA